MNSEDELAATFGKLTKENIEDLDIAYTCIMEDITEEITNDINIDVHFTEAENITMNQRD